jgi:hypothetical protein
MSFNRYRPSRALRLSLPLLTLLFALAAIPARAQQSVYPTNLTTDDCNNPGAFSRVWYVGPNGSDWTTDTGSTTIVNGNTASAPLADPQYAVSVTQPGDLVCLLAGTYGPFLVYNSGNASGWIRYEAMPGQHVIIDETGGWFGIQIAANYIQVSGFDVVGANQSLSYYTAVSYENDPQDHPDYNGNCISVDGTKSTTTPHPAHIDILQNTARECPGGGIATNQADYVTISGNVVYDNAWYSAYGTSAISTLNNYDTDGNTGYKMYITNNIVLNNMEYIPWQAAGKISDGEGIIVDSNLNNEFVSPGTQVTYNPYGGRTLIANNVFNGNGSSAIEVFESSHVDILDNSTYGNVVTPSDQPKTGSQTGELLLYTASDVRTLSNIFYAYGNSSPLYDYDTCVNCYADYNVYYGTVANYWPNGTGPGSNDSNSIFANPYYVAVSTDAFNDNLQIQSPYTNILNVGTGWLAIPTDINGKARVVSNSYTVPAGAYAYP